MLTLYYGGRAWVSGLKYLATQVNRLEGATKRPKRDRERKKKKQKSELGMESKMSHLKFIDGDPRVCRKSLQHGHQELEAS